MSVSALVINWSELNVSGRSVDRLLGEPDVAEVVVVDNGSTDGSKEHFRARVGPRLKLVDLPVNLGVSRGRNAGLFVATSSYVFLLDGDILYVPGTIAAYRQIMDLHHDLRAGCVGCYHVDRRRAGKPRDTLDEAEADPRMPPDYTVEAWFPMAWTQYGLFYGPMLRRLRFVEQPPFDGPGYGFEDDWLYMEMVRQGCRSLHVNRPLYYHQRLTTLTHMGRIAIERTIRRRRAAFEARWGPWQGHEEHLVRKVQSGIISRRPLPKP